MLTLTCSSLFILENRWSKFDVIYHDYGAVVLLYHSVTIAKTTLFKLQGAFFDEKNLLALLLPHLQVIAPVRHTH